MSQHKDLPAGSQAWAREVDKHLAEVAALKEVIKRLAENAGLDMSNPRRGVSSTATPSVKNPVGQKVSSLADVDTFNVLDGQVLGWSQQGQKWLPVNVSGDSQIDISDVSFSHQELAHAEIVDEENFAWVGAHTGDQGGQVELWGSDQVYIGSGYGNFASYALITLGEGNFGPIISLKIDSPDGMCEMLVSTDDVAVTNGTFTLHDVATDSRPYIIPGNRVGACVFDTDLGAPIWWNGVDWVDGSGALRAGISPPPAPPEVDEPAPDPDAEETEPEVSPEEGDPEVTDRDELVAGEYKPSDYTTGVPAGTVLTNYTGPSTITVAGTIIDSKIVSVDLKIQAANVVIRKSRIRGGTTAPANATGCIDANSNACFNLLIEDNHIEPQRPHYNRDTVVGHEYTARRNRTKRGTDGFGVFAKPGGSPYANVTLQGNYVSDQTYFFPDVVHSDGTHNDGCQIQGGRGILVEGNRFDVTSVAGAGSLVNPDKPNHLTQTNGPHANGAGIIVQDNVKAGLGLAYNGDGSINLAESVVIRKNWFKFGLTGANLKDGYYYFGENWFSEGNFYLYNTSNPESYYAIRPTSATTAAKIGGLNTNRWEESGLLMTTANKGIRY